MLNKNPRSGGKSKSEGVVVVVMEKVLKCRRFEGDARKRYRGEDEACEDSIHRFNSLEFEALGPRKDAWTILKIFNHL